ncbi:MAG: general stress protein CsbD [Bacteroidales bacterium]|nr:general stress protein CsbD [Bacteroidales bacterium]
MNTTNTHGSWSERKIKLRQKFASLTDNDLIFEAGNTEEMLEKLQLKLGKTKEELRRILATL